MDVVLYENNPNAGHYLMGVQAALVMAGAIAAYQEKTGTCLSYTNFSLGEKFKFKMKSKRAMLGVYSPAALISLSFIAFSLDLLSFTTMKRVLEELGATSLASILSCPSCSTSSPDNRSLILATALSLHFCKRILEVRKQFFALLNRCRIIFFVFFLPNFVFKIARTNRSKNKFLARIHFRNPSIKHNQNKGVCHTVVALLFTLKSILRQKEELWKLKYFTMQKYNVQKIFQKKPKSFKISELYN
jgi:hypothetical protein